MTDDPGTNICLNAVDPAIGCKTKLTGHDVYCPPCRSLEDDREQAEWSEMVAKLNNLAS